jgi:hypothetical protein
LDAVLVDQFVAAFYAGRTGADTQPAAAKETIPEPAVELISR